MHTSTLNYYDPETETYVTHREAEKVYSGRGCAGPSYHEVYRLASGLYLSGVRRYGDDTELTDIRYSTTRAGLLPRRRLVH